MSKKLILISTSSLLAVSPLIATISCNNKSSSSNNLLSEAVSSFAITLKSGQNVSGVLASSIQTEQQLLQYFELGGKKDGVTYTFKSSTPQTDSTKLDVVYEIEYQGQKNNKTITLEGFKQLTLQDAVSSFVITLKSGQNVSGVLASSIQTEQQLLQYFELGGKINGVTYNFESATPKSDDKTKLDVIYTISYQSKSEKKTITLEGFKQETTDSSGSAKQDQTN